MLGAVVTASGLEEEVEGAVEDAGDFFGVVDQELFEDCLVHQSSDVLVGFGVGGVDVADEVERFLEIRLHGFEFEICGGEALLDMVEVGADPVLFALEEIKRDRAGVVGLEQLGSLGDQAPLPTHQTLTIGDFVFA